jgi:sigma-B regulation protein RsbU (phosphoserine phosphatase)
MFPDSTYEEKVVRLEPGDFVIAYTDGVIEATNPGGEEWGVQGLLRAAAAWAPKGSDDAEDLVRLIFNSMDDFSQRCQSDDVTLAVLRAV